MGNRPVNSSLLTTVYLAVYYVAEEDTYKKAQWLIPTVLLCN